MSKDKNKSYWDNKGVRRYVLDPDDVGGLEREAGVHEFIGGKPQGEAEDAAYSDYKNKHHLEAAAHHLSYMKAAQANGNYDDAHRHKLIYDMHLKELGIESEDGKVPSEVEQFMQNPDAPRPIKFKGHKADSFLNEQEEGPKMLSKHEIGHEVYKTLKKMIEQGEISEAEIETLEKGRLRDLARVAVASAPLVFGAVGGGAAGYHDPSHATHTTYQTQRDRAGVSREIPVSSRPASPKEEAANRKEGAAKGALIGMGMGSMVGLSAALGAHHNDQQSRRPSPSTPQPSRLSRIISRTRKWFGRNEGTIPGNAQADFGMNESFGNKAWKELEQELAKATFTPQESAAVGGANATPIHRQLAQKNGLPGSSVEPEHKYHIPLKESEKKPYMGRDEGIRRGKLAPGTPDADKYGVSIQEDKKKKAAKEAARKWKQTKGKDE